MTHIRALIAKDLVLHWRNLVLFCVGSTLLLWALVWVTPASKRLDASGRALVTYPVLVYSLAIWVEWLVNSERTKETFAFLRALPVSDWHVVAGKFVVCWLMEFVVLVIVLALSPMRLNLNAWQTVTYVVAGLTAAAVTLAVQLGLSHRKAFAVPVGSVLVLVAVVAALAQSPEHVGRLLGLWRDPEAHIVVWLVCVGLDASLVYLSYLRFRSQDTDRLIA